MEAPPSPGSGPARSPRRRARGRAGRCAPRGRAPPRARARPGGAAPGSAGPRSPSEQHQLGAEPRAHRHQQAEVARARLPRRRAARRARRAPTPRRGSRSSAASSTSAAAPRAAAPAPPRRPAAPWGRRCGRSSGGCPSRRRPCEARKPSTSLPHVLGDDARHLGAEDDLEAAVHHVPAHDALGVRVEDAAGGEHAGRGARMAAGPRRRAPSPRRRRRRGRWR